MKRSVDVILIFDIGKTNKKYFLFDRHFTIVDQGQTKITEISDDDGDPEDDLTAIEEWVCEIINTCLHKMKFNLTGINFSTYGASLVHIGRKGNRIGHFYNYTKSFPYPIYEDFSTRYSRGGLQVLDTGSPGVGLINSGFQLYWLKYRKPEVYRQIRWSLHLPQYLSYMLTGIPVCEFTSLGCHTALWNYTTCQYDDWVTREKIDAKLAPLVSTFTSINSEVSGKKLMVGTGIHDSSAALLPYLTSVEEAFILISTGTWCVTLNPFRSDKLTAKDIANGCLYYMTTEGSPVLAHRLFLGFEFELQVNKLATVYQTTSGKIQKIKYDQDIDIALQKNAKSYFQFVHLGLTEPTIQNLPKDFDLKTAYHQLMGELVEKQLMSIKSILKNAPIRKIIIDGGFAKNNLYLKMLAARCKPMVIYANRTPAASALGAGIALKPEWRSGKWMKSNFKLKKIK